MLRGLDVQRLGPQARLVAGELLEGEVEDRGERRPRDGRPRRPSRAAGARATVVKAASSIPQAVIQSVNGAGSRSTFSA